MSQQINHFVPGVKFTIMATCSGHYLPHTSVRVCGRATPQVKSGARLGITSQSFLNQPQV